MGRRRESQAGKIDKEGEKIGKRVGMIRRNVSGSKKSESHL